MSCFGLPFGDPAGGLLWDLDDSDSADEELPRSSDCGEAIKPKHMDPREI